MRSQIGPPIGSGEGGDDDQGKVYDALGRADCRGKSLEVSGGFACARRSLRIVFSVENLERIEQDTENHKPSKTKGKLTQQPNIRNIIGRWVEAPFSRISQVSSSLGWSSRCGKQVPRQVTLVRIAITLTKLIERIAEVLDVIASMQKFSRNAQWNVELLQSEIHRV